MYVCMYVCKYVCMYSRVIFCHVLDTFNFEIDSLHSQSMYFIYLFLMFMLIFDLSICWIGLKSWEKITERRGVLYGNKILMNILLNMKSKPDALRKGMYCTVRAILRKILHVLYYYFRCFSLLTLFILLKKKKKSFLLTELLFN